MFAAEFGTGQVLWSILWFFIFFMWIMLLFQVTFDIFRSDDLSGVAKAAWILFVIIVPYLGVFVYLIARGSKMSERQVKGMQEQEAAARQYIQNAAGSSPSAAEELAKLAGLRDQGVIDEAEFARLKARLVG